MSNTQGPYLLYVDPRGSSSRPHPSTFCHAGTILSLALGDATKITLIYSAFYLILILRICAVSIYFNEQYIIPTYFFLYVLFSIKSTLSWGAFFNCFFDSGLMVKFLKCYFKKLAKNRTIKKNRHWDYKMDLRLVKTCAFLPLYELWLFLRYLGVIKRIETGPIRVIFITDLYFFPFSYINLRNRIFYCFYTGAP